MRKATLVSGLQCQQCCIDNICLVLGIDSAGDQQFRFMLPEQSFPRVSLQGVVSSLKLFLCHWLNNVC